MIHFRQLSIYLILVLALIHSTFAIEQWDFSLASMAPPSDASIGSFFTLSFSEFIFPAEFIIKVAQPGASYATIPFSGLPRPCQLNYVDLNGDSLQNELYFVPLFANNDFATPGDLINHDLIKINLPSQPSNTSSVTQFVIKCYYEAPNSHPASIDMYSNTVFLTTLSFFLTPRATPSELYQTSAFTPSVKILDDESTSIILSNLLPFSDPALGKRLSFILRAPYSFTFSTNPAMYITQGTSASGVLNLLSTHLGGGQYEILFPDGFPKDTLSAMIYFTPQEGAIAPGINTYIEILPRFSSRSLSDNFEKILISYNGNLSPTIGINSVVYDSGANMMKSGRIQGPSRELIITWTVRKHTTTGAQTIYLSPPSMYARTMTILSCTMTGSTPSESIYSRQSGFYIFRTTIENDSTPAIITCYIAFNPFFTARDPYDYFEMPVYSTQAGEPTAVIPSWKAVHVPPIQDLRSVPDLSSEQTFLKTSPRNFIRVNSPPKWVLVVTTSGAYRAEMPKFKLGFPTGYYGINFQGFKTTVYGWGERLSPLDRDFVPMNAITTSYSPGSIITIDWGVDSRMNVLTDPEQVYFFDFRMDSFPITGAESNDIRFSSTQAGLPGTLKFSSVFDNIELDFEVTSLPIAHLPLLRMVSDDVGFENWKNQGDVVKPIITCTINTRSAIHPHGNMAALLSPYSIWKTNPEVIIYPKTSIDIIMGCQFCQFDTSTAAKANIFIQATATTPSPNENDWELDLDSVRFYNGGTKVRFSILYQGADPMTIDDNHSFQISPTVLADGRAAESWIQVEAIFWVLDSMGADRVQQDQKINDFIIYTSFNPTQIGTAVMEFVNEQTMDVVTIPRLMDNNDVQMATKPVITWSSSMSLYGSYSPQIHGPNTQRIELWYHDTTLNQDFYLRTIVDSTPAPLTNPARHVNFGFSGIAKVVQNAFFRTILTSSTHPTPQNLPFIRDTVYFDIVPTCMKQDTSDNTKYLSTCAVGEVCVLASGKCEKTAIQPDETYFKSKCPRCSPTNTQSCTSPDYFNNKIEQCTCKDGWQGLTCEMVQGCTETTPKKAKCNLSNGFYPPNSDGSTCSTSTCQCYNQWAGLSCQTCQLQCFNDGLRYNDCARCGCQGGYSGSQCQCQSVVGKITIKATNDMIGKTNGKLSSSLNALHFTHDNLIKGNILLPQGSKQDDFELYAIFTELYQSLQLPLTISTNGQFSLAVSPSSTAQKTDFLFTVAFGCDESNPQIISLDQFKGVWADFVKGFVENKMIKKHFAFSTQDIISEITPTPETFPTDAEKLENGAVALSSLFNSMLIVMVMVMVVF